jgi:flagellar biosynthesis GTPase FlhF
MSDQIILGVARRSIVRRAITSHHGWTAYRREHGLDASSLGTTECIAACKALGIDIYAVLAAAEASNTTTQEDNMKERNIDAATFAAAVEGYREIRSFLPWDGAENVKCDSIIDTVQNKQNGAATSAQYMCLIRATEQGQAARAAKTGQAQTATTTTTTPPAVVPDAAVTAADPAGAALGAMVLPHILGALAPEITRIVERRLENVQTVRIEVARHDGTTGKTEGHTHPQLARLLRTCSSRMTSGYTPNAMLVGPTGTGKTHAAHQVASTAR